VWNVRHWGTTAEEGARPFPCDRWMPEPDEAFHRGVSVAAAPEAVFRWLCQLRAAPYSYDWIDNWGRASPQSLTPELDRLAVGQRFMTIFELVEFEPERQLTLRMLSGGLSERLFGNLLVTYLVVPHEAGSRLLAKLVLRYPPGAWGRVLRRLLPAGDLVMMRRQLLNLKRLAENLEDFEGRDRA